MNYLLDTHAFIWIDSNSKNLSSTARGVIEDENNQLFVSIVSIWEIQIKHRLGKLNLRSPLHEIVTQQELNNIQILSIHLDHIYALAHLPQHRRDPFDRIIIAQARVKNLTIISSDSRIKEYDVRVVW